MTTKYQVHEKPIRITSKCIGTDGILIINYKIAKMFLRTFGHLIRKLEVYSLSSNRAENDDIGYTIMKYCSKSLFELKLNVNGQYLLNQTEISFENVEIVDIHQSEYSNNIDLSRIFPNMEQLKLEIHYPNQLSALKRCYPNLRHLELIEKGIKKNSILCDVLKENPQLKSLLTSRCLDSNTIQLINENSPNLQSITAIFTRSDFIYLKQNTPSVRLAHVKNFTLIAEVPIVNQIFKIPITFENLEALEVSTNCLTSPIERFIIENDKLKVLSLPFADFRTTNTRIDHILDRLSQLEEIVLLWDFRVTVADIRRMYEKTQSLQKIRYIVGKYFNQNNLAEFQSIGSEIFATHSDAQLRQITFTRKD